VTDPSTCLEGWNQLLTFIFRVPGPGHVDRGVTSGDSVRRHVHSADEHSSTCCVADCRLFGLFAEWRVQGWRNIICRSLSFKSSDGVFGCEHAFCSCSIELLRLLNKMWPYSSVRCPWLPRMLNANPGVSRLDCVHSTDATFATYRLYSDMDKINW